MTVVHSGMHTCEQFLPCGAMLVQCMSSCVCPSVRQTPLLYQNG